MICVFNPRLWRPREACQVMLEMVLEAMCEGCPAGVGAGNPAAAPPTLDIFIQPFTNAIEITDTTVWADLDLDNVNLPAVAVNAEAAPTYCDGNIQGPGTGTDNEWRLVFDQQIWNFVGPITARGVVVYAFDGAAGRILGVGNFDAPCSLLAAGDALKVTSELVLEPSVPEDE